MSVLVCSKASVRVEAETASDAAQTETMQETEDKYSIEEAKNSVVKIQSFFTDQDGNTYRIHTGSGFIVSESSSSSYIVTSAANLPEEDDISRYCDKHQLTLDLKNITTSISVVISGDVKADAALIESMYSKQKNFCILSTNLLEGREIARLDPDSSASIGDTVWNMGYDLHSKEEGVGLENGVIQNNDALVDDISYVQTTARTVYHSTGGPLVNEQGYVIGMQDAARNVTSDDTYYALPISEITEILDEYGLQWDSMGKDALLKEVQSMIEEATQKIDGGLYKESSTEELKTAIEEAQSLLQDTSAEEEELTSAREAINLAEEELVEKTPIIKILTRIVFPAILAILLLLLVRNIIRLMKLKRQSKEESRDSSIIEKEMPSDLPKMPAFEENKNEVAKETAFDSEKTIMMYHGEAALEAKLVFSDGRTVKLGAGKSSFRIGRKKEANDVVINNISVSREHAKIVTERNHHYLMRINLENITNVNGKNVAENERRILKNNDMITLGGEEIRYEIINRNIFI